MPELNESIKNPSVPQFYFDLIARITPGTILLLLISLSFHESITTVLSGWNPEVPISVILGIALFISIAFLAYGIAITMWGIWFLISKIVHLRIDRDPETLANVGAEKFAEYYETIKSADAAAGARMTKLKAELHLAATLIIGIILLFVYHWVARGDFYPVAIVIWVGLIGVILHVRTRINGVIIHHPSTRQAAVSECSQHDTPKEI